MSTINLLLSHGADTEEVNRFGRTALHSAAFSGRLDIVSLLLDYGAVVDAQDHAERTPLSLAATYDDPDHIEVLRLLLGLGANPNSRDTNWKSPLSLAARLGLENTVKILIDSGALLNSQDLDGETPLTLAAANNHIDVVRLLLKSGADSRMKTIEGKSVIDVSLKNEEILSLVEVWQHNEKAQFADENALKKQAPPHKVTNLEAVKLCKETFAHVTYYSKFMQQPGSAMSVHELIYEDTLAEHFSSESPAIADGAEPRDLDRETANRWFHLPLNNVGSLPAALSCLC